MCTFASSMLVAASLQAHARICCAACDIAAECLHVREGEQLPGEEALHTCPTAGLVMGTTVDEEQALALEAQRREAESKLETEARRIAELEAALASKEQEHEAALAAQEQAIREAAEQASKEAEEKARKEAKKEARKRKRVIEKAKTLSDQDLLAVAQARAVAKAKAQAKAKAAA